MKEKVVKSEDYKDKDKCSLEDYEDGEERQLLTLDTKRLRL